MAFNFLDSQRQSAIDFGSEINSVDDFAKQQTSNKLTELANYQNNINSVLGTVRGYNQSQSQTEFGLQEAYQAGQSALGEKKIFDVEAIVGGAMPFVQTAKLLAKLPQAYSQFSEGASKFSDFVSQSMSGEGSFLDTAGNVIKQNIGETISDFQGRLASTGAKFVSNIQETGQSLIQTGQDIGQTISDFRTPANALEEPTMDVQARQALSGSADEATAGTATEMSQINSTTVMNDAFEGGTEATTGLPVARISPIETPSVAPETTAVAETAGETGAEVGGTELGLEAGGEAIAEAGALAVPGLGEIIGAAGLVYGTFEAIKDAFESSSEPAPPPPPPVQVPTLQEAPSYFTTSQSVANINQSVQSGV